MRPIVFISTCRQRQRLSEGMQVSQPPSLTLKVSHFARKNGSVIIIIIIIINSLFYVSKKKNMYIANKLINANKIV